MHMCVWRTPSYNTHIQLTAEMKAVPHFHYSTTLTTQLQQYVLQLHFKLLLCSTTALSPTYKEKKSLYRIDKDTVLRCKDWWPHWGHKTNWFILVSCRSQAREKVYKQTNADVARRLTLRVAGKKQPSEHLTAVWWTYWAPDTGHWLLCELLLYALLQTVHQLTENSSVWQLPELYEILSEWLWNERCLGKGRLYTVLYCKGTTGTRNLKIDRSVTGVERRIHPVSGEEEKILICHWTEWQHKNTQKNLEQ